MTVINQIKRLKSAFPNAEAGFFDLVMERAKEKGFSDQRLIDSVNNLIDTFRYPQPMVSDIVSWDKRIKLHSYNEMTEKASQFGAGVWDMFESKRMKHGTFWISKAECEQYGIDIEKL